MMNDKDIILIYTNRYIKMIGFNRDQTLRNMCLTILNKIDELPLHKMYRWIGYIQKSVIDMNLTTMTKENKFTNTFIDNHFEVNSTDYSKEEHF